MRRFRALNGAAGLAAVVATCLFPAPSATADDLAAGYALSCNPDSLTADFAQRDALPQTGPGTVLSAKNSGSGWGPAAAALPPVAVPADAGCDATTWKRERILAAALRYLNEPGNPHALQYRHHHIPGWDPAGAGPGLDCSNFTAWVYNYGLGIAFSGNVGKQYAGTAGPMGQPIPATGPFQPGDLVFLHPADDAERVSHVAIIIDDGHVVDSRSNAPGADGVAVRGRDGWYRSAVLGGWRPIV